MKGLKIDELYGQRTLRLDKPRKIPEDRQRRLPEGRAS